MQYFCCLSESHVHASMYVTGLNLKLSVEPHLFVFLLVFLLPDILIFFAAKVISVCEMFLLSLDM